MSEKKSFNDLISIDTSSNDHNLKYFANIYKDEDDKKVIQITWFNLKDNKYNLVAILKFKEDLTNSFYLTNPSDDYSLAEYTIPEGGIYIPTLHGLITIDYIDQKYIIVIESLDKYNLK